MNLRSVALLCSFFIVAQVCSMPTKCVIRWHLVKITYNLLDKMGGLFPRECLDEYVRITFPKSALESNGSKQKTVEVKAVYEVMEHIDFLFANDTLPVSWDQKKADDFQNLVFRLTTDNRCDLGTTQDDFPTRDDALKMYFDKLASFLRKKDYSVCAWEVIRKELLRLLNFILKLKRE